jgi:hypothetical protein
MTKAVKAPMNADKCTQIAADKCWMSARVVAIESLLPLSAGIGVGSAGIGAFSFSHASLHGR